MPLESPLGKMDSSPLFGRKKDLQGPGGQLVELRPPTCRVGPLLPLLAGLLCAWWECPAGNHGPWRTRKPSSVVSCQQPSPRAVICCSLEGISHCYTKGFRIIAAESHNVRESRLPRVLVSLPEEAWMLAGPQKAYDIVSVLGHFIFGWSLRSLWVLLPSQSVSSFADITLE